MKIYYLILTSLVVLIMGCSPSGNIPVILSPEEQLAIDIAKIDEYIAANSVADVQIDDATGIRYVEHIVGTGLAPTRSDVVKVDYSGWLIDNGNVFDSNNGAQFVLSQTIWGWQIMVQKMQEGGFMTIYLPSKYAYGTRGQSPNILPNAVLVFEIKLVRVGN